MNPLLRFPDKNITLPPAYFGGIDRYVAIAAHGGFSVAGDARFDKRLKSTHRCTIVDTRGPLSLTMPIVKPERYHSARWADIIVSDHGNWTANHITALESAYGRTPFFEFYIDRLAPIIREAPGRPLVEVDALLEAQILKILSLPPALGQSGSASDPIPAIPAIPYWQIRQATLGFTPGLSILDLIFSLGPEAPLHLLRLGARL